MLAGCNPSRFGTRVYFKALARKFAALPSNQADKIISNAEMAARDGIGAYVQSIGFKRKSQRYYVREDDDFLEFVYFTFEDRGFRDYGGVISKGLDRDIANCGCDRKYFSPYDAKSPRDAHVGRAGHDSWFVADIARYAAIKARWKFLGPISWFIPWDTIRDFTNEQSNSPLAGKDGWSAETDRDGCAAFSLEKWRHFVEPIYARARDPVTFLEDYAKDDTHSPPLIPYAIALARAGRMDEAKQILWIYGARGKSAYDEELNRIHANLELRAMFNSIEKVEDWARKSVQSGRRKRTEAEQAAQYLGLTLWGE